MDLQDRIKLLSRLGEYIESDNYDTIDSVSQRERWQQAKEKASRENGWFIPEFIELATRNIAINFLQNEALTKWVDCYVQRTVSRDHPADKLPAILRPFNSLTVSELRPEAQKPKNVGIVMAGNIPLVGFHDLLCVFISGHKATIKASSKDQVLIKHLVATMATWNEEINELIGFSELLKGCDAYIATGSNNSAGYFEYYFGKYPHIIRRNRTSVAVLTGNETNDELDKLADDVYLYFGLGCRNVTKLYVPTGYDFIPLLTRFTKYNYLADHHKYKNNYDYNLAIHLLNKKFYMSNKSLLLAEDISLFSPISQLNYEFYADQQGLLNSLKQNNYLQCIVGSAEVAFGESQKPSLSDYADGVDTMEFLLTL